VDVGVFRHDWAYAYDYHWHTYPIEVSPNREEKGILKPPISWELNET
jgi:lipopolysaccharide transport system ATP-binding protein